MKRLSADTEPDRFKEHVYEHAQERIQVLSDTPTAAIPIISEGTIGYIGDKIYFMIGGVLKEFSTSDTA